MSQRLISRTLVISHALARRLSQRLAPPAEGAIRRVLIAGRLLLGDTLMLTPLLAKLRATHPQAEITLLATPAFVPLYQGRPYGVRALPYEPKDRATIDVLLREPGFDLAIVPGDNRFSWLAAAMNARRIVAHSGDVPVYKNWCVDELRPYRSEPAAWGDMVADLVDGEEPRPFARGDWPAPAARPFAQPTKAYAVLHVGASTPLKFWPASRWAEVAAALEAQGLAPVWSGGRDDVSRVRECDPRSRYASFAGQLDLAQMWHLLAGASVVVAPDTGIAHLGRVAFAPTAVLFGPGSAVVCGPGSFWRNTPWRAVTVDPFPCRDQRVLFRRELDWVRRCGRSTEQCAEPICMHAISTQSVLDAVNAIARRTFVSEARTGAA
jgi:ADP-heptose:LPS heptosyltransferase